MHDAITYGYARVSTREQNLDRQQLSPDSRRQDRVTSSGGDSAS